MKTTNPPRTAAVRSADKCVRYACPKEAGRPRKLDDFFLFLNTTILAQHTASLGEFVVLIFTLSSIYVTILQVLTKDRSEAEF